MQIILQTIGNHPDELKYQKLNVKSLSKILNNPVLALNTLVKFAFDYTPRKIYLQFIGIPRFYKNEKEIHDLICFAMKK